MAFPKEMTEEGFLRTRSAGGDLSGIIPPQSASQTAPPLGSLFLKFKKGRNTVPFFNAGRLLLDRIYAYLFAVCTEAFESYNAVSESEEGIVGTFANVVTGMEVSSALSYKDVACKNKLTVGSLRAKAFGFGITAVFSGAHTFFMGEELHTESKHVIIPP